MRDIDRIEAYYAGDLNSPDEIRALRTLLLDCGLAEEWKWRAPCYVAHGRNVAMPMDFRTGAALSFFSGVLLDDPDGLLVVPGEHSRSARFVPLPSVAALRANEAGIRALVAQAVENARAGRRVEFRQDDLDWPEELEEALDADPALREAFEALTPGRRRGYILHLLGAKQPATRVARIEKHAALIRQGKGIHDR